jgi:Na+-driven multidrug efflux pump
VGLAVIGGLTLGLAPVIGARGAAVATVGGEWSVAVALLVFLVRANRALAPAARMIVPRVLGAGGTGFAAMLLPIPALPQLGIAIAAYGTMIIVLHALPREILELLPERFQRLPHA